MLSLLARDFIAKEFLAFRFRQHISGWNLT
jgi:hypothetical protein